MPRNPLSKVGALAAFGLLGILPVGVMAQSIEPVEVETAEFGGNTFDIGSLTPSSGALAADLWAGTSAEDIAFLIDNLPRRFDNPASLDLLRRTLLSPGSGPEGADMSLTAKKLLALADAGFYEEAASLAELAGGLQSRPDLSQAIAYADMLRGDTALACNRGASLREGRGEPFWLKLRVICYAANEEMAAADLTLGLLRDQGSLQGQEARLFNALVTGTAPESFAAPVTGFDYVAARQMGASFTPEQLADVSGVILRAVANDPEAALETRAYAIHEGLYMGVITAAAARSLVETLDFEPEVLADAQGALAARPADPLTPFIVYQAARQMDAPEFTIDRIMLIGYALQSAATGKQFTVLSKLFAPMADNIEVVVNYTPFAIELALAGIVAHDESLTRKWIGALAGNQSNPGGRQEAGILLSLLNLRNPALAEDIAVENDLEVRAVSQEWSVERYLEPDLIPDMVRIGLATSRTEAEGQAALSWLILSHVEGEGPMAEIRDMVAADARNVLETVDINGELEFEAALNAAVTGLVASREASGRGMPYIRNAAGEISVAGEEAGYVPASGPVSQLTPRVKPDGDD